MTRKKNAKGSHPTSSVRKQPPGSSNTKARAKKADADIGDDGEEPQFGTYFTYLNGEEGYAKKIVPIRSKRGEGHLNDPVEYIARLDKAVQMKHEGGA
jgi:hypothetical protein